MRVARSEGRYRSDVGAGAIGVGEELARGSSAGAGTLCAGGARAYRRRCRPRERFTVAGGAAVARSPLDARLAGAAPAATTLVHPGGITVPFAVLTVNVAVLLNSTPGTRAFSSSDFARIGRRDRRLGAGRRAGASAHRPVALVDLPTRNRSARRFTLMSKSAMVMRLPCGLRGGSRPEASSTVRCTAAHKPDRQWIHRGRHLHRPRNRFPILCLRAAHRNQHEQCEQSPAHGGSNEGRGCSLSAVQIHRRRDTERHLLPVADVELDRAGATTPSTSDTRLRGAPPGDHHGIGRENAGSVEGAARRLVQARRERHVALGRDGPFRFSVRP